MALVLTDGTQTPEPSPEEADESLFAAAQRLHDKGIDVLAIGIGRDVNPFQLLTIASDENNLYVARVFDEILDVVGDLTQRECLGRSKFKMHKFRILREDSCRRLSGRSSNSRTSLKRLVFVDGRKPCNTEER